MQLLFFWEKMTGLFQNDRNKVLFSYEGVFREFSSFTSKMFLLKLAKNLAYSKNNGHEEKGIYCWMFKWRHVLIFVFILFFSSSGITICLLLFPCTQLPVPLVHAEERRRREEGEEEEEENQRGTYQKRQLDKHKHGVFVCCVVSVCALLLYMWGMYSMWNVFM